MLKSKKICYASLNPQLSREFRARLEQIGKLIFLKTSIKQKEVIKTLKNVDFFIVDPTGFFLLSDSMLSRMNKIRHIVLLSTGYEGVNLSKLKKMGVSVSYCPGANAESVAEHTWAMILDLAKRVAEFDRDIRYLSAFKFYKYEGQEVYGKTLGILGTGNIGSKVAKIGQAFGMKVLGFNKTKQKGRYFNRIVELDTLLEESDILSINMPLNLETKKIIKKKEILKMKQGIIIVNTAREDLVDKKAIIEGIKNGKIFGYGIETELMKPVNRNDSYLKYPNIIINCHNAFNTREAKIRMKEMAIFNLESFIRGNSVNIINI